MVGWLSIQVTKTFLKKLKLNKNNNNNNKERDEIKNV